MTATDPKRSFLVLDVAQSNEEKNSVNGCPDNPVGPMGPWYKKVNALIKRAAACKTRDEVMSVLGEPDKVESRSDVVTASDQLRELGSTFNWAGGEAELILTYVDPYRRRKRYKFGILGEQVSSHWTDSVHANNEDSV